MKILIKAVIVNLLTISIANALTLNFDKVINNLVSKKEKSLQVDDKNSYCEKVQRNQIVKDYLVLLSKNPDIDSLKINYSLTSDKVASKPITQEEYSVVLECYKNLKDTDYSKFFVPSGKSSDPNKPRIDYAAFVLLQENGESKFNELFKDRVAELETNINIERESNTKQKQVLQKIKTDALQAREQNRIDDEKALKNKQDRKTYDFSPDGMLEMQYAFMYRLSQCKTLREGYASVFINDNEYNFARNNIKTIEKTLKPKLKSSIDALWARATKSGRLYNYGYDGYDAMFEDPNIPIDMSNYEYDVARDMCKRYFKEIKSAAGALTVDVVPKKDF